MIRSTRKLKSARAIHKSPVIIGIILILLFALPATVSAGHIHLPPAWHVRPPVPPGGTIFPQTPACPTTSGTAINLSGTSSGVTGVSNCAENSGISVIVTTQSGSNTATLQINGSGVISWTSNSGTSVTVTSSSGPVSNGQSISSGKYTVTVDPTAGTYTVTLTIIG